MQSTFTYLTEVPCSKGLFRDLINAKVAEEIVKSVKGFANKKHLRTGLRLERGTGKWIIHYNAESVGERAESLLRRAIERANKAVVHKRERLSQLKISLGLEMVEEAMTEDSNGKSFVREDIPRIIGHRGSEISALKETLFGRLREELAAEALEESDLEELLRHAHFYIKLEKPEEETDPVSAIIRCPKRMIALAHKWLTNLADYAHEHPDFGLRPTEVAEEEAPAPLEPMPELTEELFPTMQENKLAEEQAVVREKEAAAAAHTAANRANKLARKATKSAARMMVRQRANENLFSALGECDA